MSHMDYRSYVDGSISLPSTSVAGSGSSDSPVGVGAPDPTASQLKREIKYVKYTKLGKSVHTVHALNSPLSGPVVPLVRNPPSTLQGPVAPEAVVDELDGAKPRDDADVVIRPERLGLCRERIGSV